MKLVAVLLCAMAIAASAQRSEHSTLSMYPDRAFRPDSCTLCIITDPGDTLVFRDQRDTDYIEDFAVYELLSFLPEQDCWVISKVCYEWAITLLVDGSDGSTTEAVSHPEPSPDGTRLLCANVDIMAGFLDNGIQVWRMDRDSLVLEFQDLSVPWGPDEARWAGDSLIVFQKRTYDWELEEFSSRPGWLELSGDGTWVPDDPADWEL